VISSWKASAGANPIANPVGYLVLIHRKRFAPAVSEQSLKLIELGEWYASNACRLLFGHCVNCDSVKHELELEQQGKCEA